MGILSGLKKFGVDMDEDIYGDNKAKISEEQALKAAKAKEEAEKQAAAAAAKKAVDEASYLLAKSYECPVCDKPFKSLAVKANRSRVVSSDIDLKPIYEPVDTLKYTVVSCPYCGYSALTRTFPYLTSNQKKFVREKITKKYASSLSKGDQTTYSYEEALKRYELAFATAMAITAKTSEKAYLCLSMSWLVRGQRKLLDVN
nr:DUF2225 domain-containing protein [Lachnospiraceae bacterium]